MTYSGSASLDVELNGLLLGLSMGKGEAGGRVIDSGWRGSGVSEGIASEREVSYAMVRSVNSRTMMVRSRETRNAWEGLCPDCTVSGHYGSV